VIAAADILSAWVLASGSEIEKGTSSSERGLLGNTSEGDQ